MREYLEGECDHKSPCCKEGACKKDASCGKEKCKANILQCGDKNINNIILIFNVVHIFGIAIFAYFPIWFGIKSFKILIGCDYEVYQKQLLENEKNENKGKDNEKEKKEIPKKDKKKHLKSE